MLSARRHTATHSATQWLQLVTVCWWLMPFGCGRIGYDVAGSNGGITADGGLDAPRVTDSDSTSAGGGNGGTSAINSDGSVLSSGGSGGVAGLGGASAGSGSSLDGSTSPDGAPPGGDAGNTADSGSPANCSDGSQNGDETGIDCGGSCDPCTLNNSAPVASALITPGTGWSNNTATVFLADATGSWDAEDSFAQLSFEWDWEGDGTYDATGATPAGITYSTPGPYEVRLRVTDSGGLQDVTVFYLIVRTSTNVIIVTTPIDEDDAGDAPGATTGDGLSLREAINYTNARANAQAILVPDGYYIMLDSGLPDLSDIAGTDIVADGATIDGTNLGNAVNCFIINGDNNRIIGLEITNCPSNSLGLKGDNNLFSRGILRNNDQSLEVDGDNNVVSYCEFDTNGQTGIELNAPATILFNSIHGPTSQGLKFNGSADNSVVIGNTIYANDIGVGITMNAAGVYFVKNTIVANTGAGVDLGNNPGFTFRNNLISHNGGDGIGGSAVYTSRTHNNFYQNATPCGGCTLGTGSLLIDPGYVNFGSNDFRLTTSSGLIDAGVDTSDDFNGAYSTDDFNGANPDIGADEMP